MHSGDCAKTVIVVLCLAFLACIGLHESDLLPKTFFSEAYLRNGFCVDTGSMKGHDLCFYADLNLALLMMALVYRGRSIGLGEEALAPMSKNAVSLAGHGCGHLFLSFAASGGRANVLDDLSPSSRLLAFLAFMPVWAGFTRNKRNSTLKTLTMAVFHNGLQMYVLPFRFFFTHVLMAVLLGSALRWLNRPACEKTRYYALESWLVDVPICLASFGEALTCDSFLINYGGHVWFDMVVPVGFTLYYILLVSVFAKDELKEKAE